MNKLSNLIENLISSGVALDTTKPETLKIRFINILGFIGLGIFFIYSLINFLIQDYIVALIELVTVLAIIVSMVLLRVNKNVKIASNSAIVILTVFSIYNFLFGGFNNTGLLWIYTFPPIAFFLAGKKSGTIYLVSLFIVLVFTTILYMFGIINLPYDLFTIQMFLITLGLTSLFNANYEVIQEEIIGQLKNKIEDIKFSSKRMEDTLVQNERFQHDIEHTIKQVEEKNKNLEEQKLAMINLIEDVEEEKKITKDQAQKLKQFKEAVDNAQQHTIFTDINGTILYSNKAVSVTTGYETKEIIGKNPKLWGGQMPKEFYEKLWRTIKEDKKIFEGEITNRKKSGELYIAFIQIFPILDFDNNVKFFVGLERDITKQKEIDKSKSEFVSIASHQLRTPLNAIRWLAEILGKEQTGVLNEKQKELLSDLVNTNQRMIELVGDLLDVSRIETGTKFDLKIESHNLHDIIEDVIASERVLIFEKKIDIENNIPQDLVATFDRQKISQVARNLVDNAIKYSPENTSIKIGIESNTDSEITFFIQDEGFGISTSDQENIFNKFFRASNAQKTNTAGSGLGLYIVKEIVEAHKGKISFKSQLGKGTTFFITLPKA